MCGSRRTLIASEAAALTPMLVNAHGTMLESAAAAAVAIVVAGVLSNQRV